MDRVALARYSSTSADCYITKKIWTYDQVRVKQYYICQIKQTFSSSKHPIEVVDKSALTKNQNTAM